MGKHVQQVADTKANINAIGAGNYKPQFLYLATDTPYEFAYGLQSGNLSAWINPATIGTPYTFNDTATIDFTNSSGTVTAAVKLDAAGDNLISATGSGLYAKKYTVAAGSSSLLSINGSNEISVSALAVIDVTTNTTSTSLAAALTAAGYASGNLIYQEGDMLILTAATGGMQIWVQTGGTAGTVADFTQIEAPNLSDSYIRSLMSQTAPITYNTGTGAIGLAFQNALQNSGGNLVWGGALTADTTVSGAFNVIFNIGSTKSVTLGASAGASRFNVDGDMEVTDNTKGLILKNGSARWRVTVAADGSLTTTSI
jgi:hypothetical protein